MAGKHRKPNERRHSMMPNRAQLEPATAALPAPIITLVDRLAPKIDALLDNPDYPELRDAYGGAVAIFVRAELSPAEKDSLRRWCPALTRPATADEIATHVGLQIAAFPHLGKIEARQLARVLADDISAEAPTIYELRSACRAMRRKCEFFSEAAMMTELERARQRTKMLRGLIGHGR
jgi:hypothetical protein